VTTGHLALTDVLMAQLQAEPPLCDGPIARGRAQILLGKTFTGAIGVRLARAGGRGFDLADAKRWETGVVIEMAVRVKEDEDAHSAVDGLLDSVYARVVAAEVPPDVQEWPGDTEIRWEIDDGDSTVAFATLILRPIHITGPSNLAAFT
jgi:hypothetical protein